MALPTQLFILVATACLLPRSVVALPLSSTYWERDNDAFGQDPALRQASLGAALHHIASLPSLDGLPVDREAVPSSRYSKRIPSHNYPFRTSVGRYGKRGEASRLNDGDDYTVKLPAFPELDLPDTTTPYGRQDHGRAAADWTAGGHADHLSLSQQLPKRAMYHLRTTSSRYGRRKRSAE